MITSPDQSEGATGIGKQLSMNDELGFYFALLNIMYVHLIQQTCLFCLS